MIETQTFSNVASAASALDNQSRYLAGGTLLMRQINYGDQSFNKLLFCNDPDIRAIRWDGSRVYIGAGTTMSDLLSSRELSFLAPVARSIGGPAIRNMATVGGNLFASRPYGDLTTALLALDATLFWSDGREQKMEEFLKQGQAQRGIVSSICFNIPQSQSFKYLKVSRVKPKGVSVMTLALKIERQSGRIGQARIAFGGMGPVAMRAVAAENALVGATLDKAGIQSALSVVNDGLMPEDDSLASAWYRQQVAPVHLKRLLLQRSEF